MFGLFTAVGSFFAPYLGWLFFIGILMHLIPILIVTLLPEQNLKKKYGAQWAFVSGASSGLGKAISHNLARQGLNIVLCALDDTLLAETHKEFVKKYPKLEFRKVGCNLGDPKGSYLQIIKDATADISVQVVFSNAGYIIISLFPKTKLERLMQNWTCNITSHIEITHHFFERMVNEKKRGCIVYTSSNAGFWPSPTTALYSASKAAMIQMAEALAIEGKEYGVEVTAIVAGPMQTRFVDNVEGSKLDTLKSFMKIASTPESVATVLMKSVGRVAIRDHSLLTIFLRNLFKVLDFNVFVKIVAIAQPYTPDWKQLEH